jgi:hypothetical protein
MQEISAEIFDKDKSRSNFALPFAGYCKPRLKSSKKS